jgi:hypothetical protein
MNLFQKQPADQLDYDLEFSDWLTSGDTINGATAVSDVPTELIIQSVSVSGQIVKVWISGGVTGSTYKVTATVTTAQGRIKELDFKIRVKEY